MAVNAQRCVNQAEILIRKLRKLFRKGSGSIDTPLVEAEQIDTSEFQKATRYIYKSEFELRRAELHHIKADILMVYLTYLADSAAPPKEKTGATDQMTLVYNKKGTSVKGLKKARFQRGRDADEQIATPRRDPNRERYAVYSGDEDDLADGPEVIYDKVEDVQKESEHWLE